MLEAHLNVGVAGHPHPPVFSQKRLTSYWKTKDGSAEKERKERQEAANMLRDGLADTGALRRSREKKLARLVNNTLPLMVLHK